MDIVLLTDTGATTSSLNNKAFASRAITQGRSVGINGIPTSHDITSDLEICNQDGKFLCKCSFALLFTCPVSLAGRDLLSKLRIKIIFEPNGTVSVKSPDCDVSVQKRVDIRSFFVALPPPVGQHKIWAESKDSVGFLNCTPYRPTIRQGCLPIFQKQYPLSEEKLNGIDPQIELFLQKGILTPVISPWNTPINPVRKANGTWRLVQDLRPLNKCITPLPPLVADISTIKATLTAEDLANAFFSVPVDAASQPLFSFSWKRGQLTWTRLPQGFVDSPAAFSMVLNQSLTDWVPEHGSVLIQYVDDLLIGNGTEIGCSNDSVHLLDHLADKGHLASFKKVQWCSSRVEYLGAVI